MSHANIQISTLSTRPPNVQWTLNGELVNMSMPPTLIPDERMLISISYGRLFIMNLLKMSTSLTQEDKKAYFFQSQKYSTLLPPENGNYHAVLTGSSNTHFSLCVLHLSFFVGH